MNKYHVPVLLKEVIELLNLKPGDNAIDCTLGGGGHSLEILKQIGPSGKLLGIDEDPAAIKEVKSKLSKQDLKRVILVQDDFVNLKSIVKKIKFEPVQIVLLDLGVSSYQIDQSKRGFSFRLDGPLDMTFRGTAVEGGGAMGGKISAYDVINTYSIQKLKQIFQKYADITKAGGIAHKIVRARETRSFKTTSMLVEAIVGSPLQKRGGVSLSFSPPQIKLLAKVFQAIRIEVNQELIHLKQVLPQIVSILKPRGRVAIISYHSGEDRIVKHYFRQAALNCICPPDFPECRCDKKSELKVINKKIIKPTEAEVKKNPRARSAKLRVAEKL